MNPFPSDGFPSPFNFCTPPGACSADADEAAAPVSPKPGRSAASHAAKPRRDVRFETISDPPLRWALRFDAATSISSGQGKTKHVASCGDGNVLLAVHRVAHWRSVQRLASVEVP